MDLIAMGDIHGRPIWKKIVAKEQADKYVFIADYFDSGEGIKPKQQLKNFIEILDFKRANPDKVILLFGNHEFHYLPGMVSVGYRGYQPEQAIIWGQYLRDAVQEGLLQMCYLHDQIFFSHAGISKTFIRESGILPREQSINDLFYYRPYAFKFYGVDRYGDDVTQSPIWIRPDSLVRDGIGCVQVVGHTKQEQITCVNNKYYFIDTLGTSGQYLKISDGKIITECKHIKM